MRASYAVRRTSVPSLFCLFFVLATLSAPALSADAPPGITLSQAINDALRNNPALAGQGALIAEAAARRDQAGLKPPLTIGADLENVLGTGRVGAVRNLEATLRLSTVIEMGEKRSLRIGAANQALSATAAQRDIQTLDLLANVARRFIGNLADQEKVGIAEEHVVRAKDVLDAVRQRTRAGIGSPVEEGNALVHLQELEVALAAAQSELRQSWGLLAATWAAPPDGTGRASGDLYALPDLGAFATFADRLARNPHVARFAADRAAAEARARLSRAGRTADVTVSAGVRRLEAFNDQALVLGFSMPLGSSGRNAAAEREADARATQATYAEAAAKVENLALLHGLHEQAAQARAKAMALRDQTKPIAEKTLTRAQEGFRAGRFSLFEVSAAQEQLHGIEEDIVDAAETYHQAIAEIERLTNEPVEPTARPGATP
jgi:outer membrane protein, heavy metal efflux system